MIRQIPAGRPGVLEAGCLVLGPVFLAASTFFWNQGQYGITGGTLLVVSMCFWIPAFAGLFRLLEPESPGYRVAGYLCAVAGCISGASFGMVGVLTATFHVSHGAFLAGAAAHGLAYNILLFWSGPLFPLSLLTLGLVLGIKRKIAWPVAGLICLGAVAFPLSRIPRIVLLAHLADLLLVIPLVWTGCRNLTAAAGTRSHKS